jgi:hypothetical protein
MCKRTGSKLMRWCWVKPWGTLIIGALAPYFGRVTASDLHSQADLREIDSEASMMFLQGERFPEHLARIGG